MPSKNKTIKPRVTPTAKHNSVWRCCTSFTFIYKWLPRKNFVALLFPHCRLFIKSPISFAIASLSLHTIPCNSTASSFLHDTDAIRSKFSIWYSDIGGVALPSKFDLWFKFSIFNTGMTHLQRSDVTASTRVGFCSDLASTKLVSAKASNTNLLITHFARFHRWAMQGCHAYFS